jgi:hypothetical protein
LIEEHGGIQFPQRAIHQIGFVLDKRLRGTINPVYADFQLLMFIVHMLFLYYDGTCPLPVPELLSI